ncbi:hypothetical protein KP509_28G007200 [Ceratopteris richardii]|uniref:Secreted protein n=1 Tax=Ceratopteris richardii TaxID=49495 RepID=A0A8T2RBT9_CERRI|nr:hypothetical protein KP509_28G007200 [Ceratopteris richardii]
MESGKVAHLGTCLAMGSCLALLGSHLGRSLEAGTVPSPSCVQIDSSPQSHSPPCKPMYALSHVVSMAYIKSSFSFILGTSRSGSVLGLRLMSLVV